LLSLRVSQLVDNTTRPTSGPVWIVGGKLYGFSCIEDPPLIAKILGHVPRREALFDRRPRAPPGLLSELNLT